MRWMKQFHAYSKTVTIKKSFISFVVSQSGTLKFKPAIQSHFIHLWFLFSILPHFSPPDTLFNLRSSLLCSVPWEFESLQVSLSSGSAIVRHLREESYEERVVWVITYGSDSDSLSLCLQPLFAIHLPHIQLCCSRLNSASSP